jgi:broad specificity phosphatase PhoE
MAFLILVKHAMPEIAPTQPSRMWRLGAAGRRGAAALVPHLAPFPPARLIASPEPKASETAAILGAGLGISHTVIDGLEEHHRATAGFLGVEAFQQTMAPFFESPGQLVFGEETADAAYERFAAAVDRIVADAPSETHIVVAHGTVIALFVSRRAGIAPFPLWQRLGLPSFVALNLPARLVTVVDAVEQEGGGS